jgi:alpha-mannosidase
VKVTVVPHTHWDREWYEPFSVFVERLVGMMDTLLDLCADGFPHFHLDGQTAMIDDYLERRPERAEELASYVRSGQLSAGPWVTQMDEFLVSGESHVRNLRMGLERARQLGAEPIVGYLPDQFGHIGQMPRILRDHGLAWATVWRGVPRAIDRSTFRWQSTDGEAEVLCEYLPFGYSSGWTLFEAADPEAVAATIQAEVDRLRSYLVDDRLVLMVGYDHAGPDETLPEKLEAAMPLLEGIEARVGSLREHFEGRMLDPEELPVLRGELRSSARAHLLPNVVSSRVHQKCERGRLETMLERIDGSDEELRRAWTLMLWNGAHDSVCGCSHDRVAADVDARFAEVRAIVEKRGAVGVPPRTVGEDVALRPHPGGFDVEGVPLRFLDEPDVGDLYNFCWAEEGQVPAGPDKVDVHAGRFESAWDRVRVDGHVTRHIDEPFVRIDGVIHNDREDHRLRLHVGLPQPASTVVAGAPFELVERPLVGEGGEIEAPSATWPARHVVMASGTAIFHEGVFEYEVLDGAMAVTLLRCVGAISRERLATRPWPAGPTTPTPNAQMLGDTEFRLAVWPAASRDELIENWERFAIRASPD